MVTLIICAELILESKKKDTQQLWLSFAKRFALREEGFI